jgi:hypothetical protein
MNRNSSVADKLIVHRSSFIVCLATFAAILLVAATANRAPACPFCMAIEPTLAERRESASAVALGEAAGRVNGKSQEFRLHTIFKGPAELKKRASIDAASPATKEGRLAILFAAPDDQKQKDVDHWDWSTAFANEALLGYFAAAPDLREPSSKRLAYFVRYLEHADRDIARDAYMEFAHATYEEVRAVADQFDFSAVRRWLASERVPEERKGFYGVVLGMAQREADKAANRALLKRLILEDRSDFRAGFDGMLAGYLLLSGKEGLEQIGARYLTNTSAKHGDARHAMSALRFYYDYGPSELRDVIARYFIPLVGRPEFAAAATIDLARWQRWEALDQVAAVYRSPQSDGPTRRAVVAFLQVCPKPHAEAALEQLRKQDPKGVEAIEKSLLLPKGKER